MQDNPQADPRGRLVSELDKEIFDNDREIRMLASKIIRSDYEQKHMDKLREKQRVLLEKQREHDSYVREQQLLEKLAQARLNEQRQFKRNMNEDYRTELQRKQANIAKQERLRIENERDMTRQAHEKLQHEAAKQKYFHELYRQRAMSDVELKQRLKEHKREDAEKEKALIRKQYQDSLLKVNPKATMYKQFYAHLNEVQHQAEENYKATVLARNVEKEISKENLVNKGVYDVAARNQAAYIDSVNRSIDAKKDLREYLKKQMDEKDLMRNREKEQTHTEGLQQLAALQLIAHEERGRLQSVRDETKFSPQPHERSLVAAYNSRRASESQLSVDRKLHNPITNPIDFKFGYTNPYLVREFEQAKREAVGDGHLRLGKLALLGSSSLMK